MKTLEWVIEESNQNWSFFLSYITEKMQIIWNSTIMKLKYKPSPVKLFLVYFCSAAPWLAAFCEDRLAYPRFSTIWKISGNATILTREAQIYWVGKLWRWHRRWCFQDRGRALASILESFLWEQSKTTDTDCPAPTFLSTWNNKNKVEQKIFENYKKNQTTLFFLSF